MKTHILTSVWHRQHPNAGQNIQQMHYTHQASAALCSFEQIYFFFNQLWLFHMCGQSPLLTDGKKERKKNIDSTGFWTWVVSMSCIVPWSAATLDPDSKFLFIKLDQCLKWGHPKVTIGYPHVRFKAP